MNIVFTSFLIFIASNLVVGPPFQQSCFQARNIQDKLFTAGLGIKRLNALMLYTSFLLVEYARELLQFFCLLRTFFHCFNFSVLFDVLTK